MYFAVGLASSVFGQTQTTERVQERLAQTIAISATMQEMTTSLAARAMPFLAPTAGVITQRETATHSLAWEVAGAIPREAVIRPSVNPPCFLTTLDRKM